MAKFPEGKEYVRCRNCDSQVDISYLKMAIANRQHQDHNMTDMCQYECPVCNSLSCSTVFPYDEDYRACLSKGEQISQLLLEMVADRFDKEALDVEGLEFGDSFAELIDKFIVLHIRMWKLEDAIAVSDSAYEIANLKKKSDYCFKNKRPKLTAAINSFLDVYISKNHTRLFAEENTKHYKGFQY